MLTKIQEERFLSIAGKKYDGKFLKGKFSTEFPFNDREWKLSPWWFSFEIEEKTGSLFCDVSHNITNNRMYGWDKEGNKLPHEEVINIYPKTDPFVAMFGEFTKKETKERMIRSTTKDIRHSFLTSATTAYPNHSSALEKKEP